MRIRPAMTHELPVLQNIERAAGAAFRDLGMAAVADDDPPALDVLDGYLRAGRAWVACDAEGRPVLPVRWSDNEVSLWPGESVTLTARCRTADLHGSAPRLRISGWNTPEHTVPAA